jgi:hypothetical protein
VVETDAGRQSEQTHDDAHPQVARGAGPMALQVEQILAGSKHPFDALTDGSQLSSPGSAVRGADEVQPAAREPARVAPGVAIATDIRKGGAPDRLQGAAAFDRGRGKAREQVTELTAGAFPAEEHCYRMLEGEEERFRAEFG